MACATVCALNRSFTALTHGSHLSFFTMRDAYHFHFLQFFAEKTTAINQKDLKVEVELNMEGRSHSDLGLSNGRTSITSVFRINCRPKLRKKPANKLSWLGAQPTILPA